ncbi:hypothetical protein ACP3V3_02805 [Vibrio sp. PNB22_3_1]
MKTIRVEDLEDNLDSLFIDTDRAYLTQNGETVAVICTIDHYWTLVATGRYLSHQVNPDDAFLSNLSDDISAEQAIRTYTDHLIEMASEPSRERTDSQ